MRGTISAWPALARHVKADAEGNCAVADFIHVDAARNIIYDARTGEHRTPIAVVGCAIPSGADGRCRPARAQILAQKIMELVKKLAEDARLKKLV